MSRCNTHCIEKPLSRGFETFGCFVGRHSWWFFIVPLFISAGLGGGFYFLADREANGIEEMFTPINGPAKTERKVVQKYFPQNDSAFSRLRLYTEGTYASIIIVSSTENILTVPTFKKIVQIDNNFKNLKVGESAFQDLCVKKNGMCVSNAIFQIVKNATEIATTTITYPYHGSVFIASEIGGVELKSGSTAEIGSAKAIRLFYFLKEDNQTVNNIWLHRFIETASKIEHEHMTISYFTSLSRNEEFEKSSESIIPLFSLTYTLGITFSITSCLRLDCVRNKVWVASIGVLSAGMAVLSSFGLLLYCGMPFAMTVASAPFLILGIGVDDMFIMISCWQQTQVKDSVKDRMASTYKHAAVSITITTLTDALAFYIGLLTPFGSVQSFCMYTGTAVLFCYLYNITFFGAFLALNGKREKDNRHWLTCMKVPEPEINCKNYNLCCVGGAYDQETGKEEPMPINNFFKTYYGPFLTRNSTKVFVIILYLGYLGSSIYGCFQIKEGIDLKNLAADGSYVASYYDNDDKFFSEYGPIVMVIVDDKFKYWDTKEREQLFNCLHNLEDLQLDGRPMVAKNMTISWLKTYLESGTFPNQTIFMDKLPAFLIRSGFLRDVNISNQVIIASRMFIQTVNISTAVDEKNILNNLRSTANDCPVDLVVYHPAFIYFDQYAVIVSNTIQNIVAATVAMLVISLMLIPSPICSLWVTFAIASVIVGVAGFMALWDVNLDSVSMINLVICIGFSVDFSAHISYAFVSSNKKTANEKAIDAVFHLGYPILQGAVSTILGVVVLSAAGSYIFRTFFKIMFLVILFGAVHGIVFIPVFLTFFGICSAKISNKEHVDVWSSKNVSQKSHTSIAQSMGDSNSDNRLALRTVCASTNVYGNCSKRDSALFSPNPRGNTNRAYIDDCP
ncbi:patched domain-containing protein 3-like [Esox lucius]|uniref:Patched domain-containing protein 3 n=1 Tax=Esox lucius TaxID=8010 RepID=A0A3P8XW11_ESOLU|nr:patched domain-containing protein 3-like [Esox lucius]